MKRLYGWALPVLLLIQAAVASAEPLTVAVAANVKYAFDALASEFTRDTGVEVKAIVASSGKLTAQIRNGAPYDVFLSADMQYPEALFKDGHAVVPPRVYAYGTLVLWTQGEFDLAKGVAGLADDSVRRVAVANPRLAPYGLEAVKALDFFKVSAAVNPKLVYGENIAQVNQYVDSKSVDVGFTSKSVVVSPELQGKGRWVEVPAESYAPIAQGFVILKYGAATHGEAARKFYGFVLSAKGRQVLAKYGYQLP